MRAFSLAFAMLLLAACQAATPDSNTSASNGCADVWSKGDLLDVDVMKATATSESLDKALVARIEVCFRDRHYDGAKVNFRDYEVLRMPNGEAVAVFNILGVFDVELGVLISTDGRLVKAGWTSLNF